MTSSPWWPAVRAALILVVVVAHGLVAIPIGPRTTAESLATEHGRREIDVWMRLAGPLGFTREGFEDVVVTWSDRLVTADDLLTKPIKKVLHVFGQGQAWALFAGTDRDPIRLEVVGRRSDGAEVLLYRRLEGSARFLSPVLDYRRVRGVYDLSSKSLPPRYKNFCRYVARRAFETYPDLTEVTVRQAEVQVRLPHEAPDPSVSYKYALGFQRAQLLGGEAP